MTEYPTGITQSNPYPCTDTPTIPLCTPGSSVPTLLELWQPGQCPTTLWGKKLLPKSSLNLPCYSSMFRWSFLGIIFCPVSQVTLLDTSEQRLLQALTPFWIFVHMDESPLAHLFPRLSRPRSLVRRMLQSPSHFGSLHWTRSRSSTSLSRSPGDLGSS